MNLEKLSLIAEDLREKIVGNPVWIKKKNVFEYEHNTLEVVVILKLLRGIQGIKAQEVLCKNGLFTDMGAIFRCVTDCSDEIYFMLEKYPEQSKDVNQFIKHFFEHTIDGVHEVKTNTVPKKKIHAAKVRMFSKFIENNNAHSLLKNIHKTFCGYTHANYSHIMQNFGGDFTRPSFNILGIPSDRQKMIQFQMVSLSYGSILLSMMLICRIFKQEGIYREVEELLEVSGL
jgi:hypothetical protein